MKFFFIVIIALFQFHTGIVFGKNNILETNTLLSPEDIKIYKQIFIIQSQSIQNRNYCNCSSEWKKERSFND